MHFLPEAFVAQISLGALIDPQRMCVGWVLTKKNAYDQFAKRVVASLLVDGSNSPMYQVRCLVRKSRYVFNIREPWNRGL
jgi:hypothetical protein